MAQTALNTFIRFFRKSCFNSGQNITANKDPLYGDNLPIMYEQLYIRPAKKEDIGPLLSEGKLIGQGAFGSVCKAEYKGQTVALKHLNQENNKGMIQGNVFFNEILSFLPFSKAII